MKNSTERLGERWIAGPQDMERAIRDFGFIPLFKGDVPGWSIQEMTAPGCWFTENGADGILGPWDWKVDVVQRGDIAYGKFLGGKAAFATIPFYRDLMLYRRSLSRLDPAQKENASLVLDAIRENGALGARQIRAILAQKHGIQLKKAALDSILQFLQMGTWTVVGDIQRVYRGPELSYSGWQLSSNTTPDELFDLGHDNVQTPQPSWAKRFAMQEQSKSEILDGDPLQARERLIGRVLSFSCGTPVRIIEKII